VEAAAGHGVDAVLDRAEVIARVEVEVGALADQRRMRPLPFSLVGRCQGEWGSAKYTSMPHSSASSAWQAISRPWSQVRVRRSGSGIRSQISTSAARVSVAPGVPSGDSASHRCRLARSKTVAIAERL